VLLRRVRRVKGNGPGGQGDGFDGPGLVDIQGSERAQGGRHDIRGRTRIVLRHIIPNSIGTIIVNATFNIADAILLLAALGYIGLGVPSPQTDWGSMLSNGVNYALDGYWWEIYPAGLCIVLVVVAFNFIGDALRDFLDPRSRIEAGL